MKSFAGTVSYMAPEVLKRSGYREEADWWSMAVVAFELLFGKRPFRAQSGKEVMYKIVHAQFRFPSYSVREISEECIDFITRCLERDHSKRLGVGSDGIANLKSHPWFRDIDWKAVERKAISPPFTPNLKTGNFSAIHEAEDILLEDKPLKPNKRQSMIAPSDPEHLSIAEKFYDYDFTWDVPEEEKRAKLAQVAENSQRLEQENEGKELEVEDNSDDQEGNEEEDLDDDMDDTEDME